MPMMSDVIEGSARARGVDGWHVQVAADWMALVVLGSGLIVGVLASTFVDVKCW